MKRVCSMTLFLLLPLLVSGARTSSGAPKEKEEGISPDAESEIRRATGGDLATSMNEAVDSGNVYISSGMYRAIQAVQKYREKIQGKVLTANERRIDNYDIWITSGPESKWLQSDEIKSCYAVVFYAKHIRGERILTDTPSRLGRSAVYSVRKVDYRVLRVKLGEVQ